MCNQTSHSLIANYTTRFDDKSFSPFGALKSIYIHSHSSADEYMISLQPKNEGKGQHFVRVLFKAGVPEISNVTKHNEKDWVTINFDILCLHRYMIVYYVTIHEYYPIRHNPIMIILSWWDCYIDKLWL